MAVTPPRRPRARRAMTPTVLVGTTSVTGASGSPPLAARTAAASASKAAAPWGVTVTWIGTSSIVRKGCHRLTPAGRPRRVGAARRRRGRARPGPGRAPCRRRARWRRRRRRRPPCRGRCRRRPRCRPGRPRSSIIRAHLGHLGLHRRQVALAAEARVDGHHQHQLDQVEHVGDRPPAGVAGTDGHAGGRAEVVADHPQRPVQVGGRLGVHDQAPAPGLDESSAPGPRA